MFRRFAQDKRGVSAVIGAIFFVLILLAGFSMITWEITQYDNYMQVVNERNRLDWEKQNEIIEIVSVYVVGDSLSISVINNGAVAAHLVDLWVTEYSSTTANWHRFFQIDYYVNPGNTITNIGQDIETLVIDPKLTYVVKIVTERGNIAMGDTLQEPELPPPVHAFGVFSLDWFYFKYTSDKYPTPRSAGVISKPTEDYVAFYIKVTNNYDETMTIKSSSMILLMVEWQEPLFYIVEDVYYSSTDWKTDWDYTTSQKHTGSYSIHAGSSDTTLTSADLNTSDATNVTVSFWYRDDDIDDSDNVYLQFWDGSTYDNIFELGNTSPEDTWHYYTVTTSDPQYLISDFHIRFDATGIDSWGENLWVDGVLITKTTGEGEVTLLSDGFENPPTSPVITAYDDANPITIGPYESQILIFAAERAGLTDWAWDSSIPYERPGTEGAIVMAALVFTMESKPTQLYAQSLPFQALVLSGE